MSNSRINNRSKEGVNMKLPNGFKALVAVAYAVGLPVAVQGQTPSPLAEWQFSGGVPLRGYFIEKPPKWEYEVGLAFAIQPKYDGAKDYRILPGPTVDIRYRDIAFISTGEGLGWNILHGKTYRAGLALTYDFGRRLNRDAKDRGLGSNVNAAPEFKLFAEYVWFPVVFRGDVRRAIGGYDGVVGDLSVYLPVVGSEKFFVLVGPTVTYGNTSFQQEFFGVSGAQAQARGVQPFVAESGLKSYGLGSNATWLINDHWRLNGSLSANRLIGDAASSPTTARKTQYGFALSLDYNWSKP
jgi:outer membrane scaffolding protein for murein synthesis (MipA/OmpV family)